ncbi:hypothetical protein [Longispora fulva]|uniref:Uncharacterized protein n=1 Tax=Longispora fulva TaxID=619741 RepID=A0A8J7KZU5_9ACTN|nr:hypothetical protein [Longispora fulva]MBG6141707.1 hypothetical protein [Longispora fulva]
MGSPSGAESRPGAGHGSAASRGPEVARAPVGAWRDLPPLQRTVGDHPLTNPTDRFSGGLTAWQDPTFLAPLRHAVGPAEPSGVVSAVPAPPEPTVSEPTLDGPRSAYPSAGGELPVVERGPVSRLLDRVVQRLGGGPGQGGGAPTGGADVRSAGSGSAIGVDGVTGGVGRSADGGATGPHADAALLGGDGSGAPFGGEPVVRRSADETGPDPSGLAGPAQGLGEGAGPVVQRLAGDAGSADRGSDGASAWRGAGAEAGAPRTDATGSGARRTADGSGHAGGDQSGARPAATGGAGFSVQRTAAGGPVGEPGPVTELASGGEQGRLADGGVSPGDADRLTEHGSSAGEPGHLAEGGTALGDSDLLADGPLLGDPGPLADGGTSAGGASHGVEPAGPDAISGGLPVLGSGSGAGQNGGERSQGLLVSRSADLTTTGDHVHDPGQHDSSDVARRGHASDTRPQGDGSHARPPGDASRDGSPSHGASSGSTAPVVQRAASSDAPLLGDTTPPGSALDRADLAARSDQAPGAGDSAPDRPAPAPGDPVAGSGPGRLSTAGSESRSGADAGFDAYPGATATSGESASGSAGLISGDFGAGPLSSGPTLGAGQDASHETGGFVQRATDSGTASEAAPGPGARSGAGVAGTSAGQGVSGRRDAGTWTAGQAGSGAADASGGAAAGSAAVQRSVGEPRRLGLGAPLAPGEMPPGLPRTTDFAEASHQFPGAGPGALRGFPDQVPGGVRQIADHGPGDASRRIADEGPGGALRQTADGGLGGAVQRSAAEGPDAPTLGGGLSDRAGHDDPSGLPDTHLTWSDTRGTDQFGDGATADGGPGRPEDTVRVLALPAPAHGPSTGLLGHHGLPVALQRAATGSPPSAGQAPSGVPSPPAGPPDTPLWSAPHAEPVEVQRAVEVEAPSMVPVLTRTPEMVVQRAEEAAPAPAPATGDGAPEELLKKLFDPLLRRLKAELRLDRDRRGVLTDLRH